jgi:chaperonin GroES
VTTQDAINPTKIRLLGGLVLLEVEKESERASPESLIVIPLAYRGRKLEERWNIGKILRMGPGMNVARKKSWKRIDSNGAPIFLWPMPDVTIGARVVYRTWAVRHAFEHEGKKFEIVSDESIDLELLTDAHQKLRPIYDRVVVRDDVSPKTTVGGILIPDAYVERATSGVVMAAGSGQILSSGMLAPLTVSQGDRVWFDPFAGTVIELDGVKLRILRISDLQAHCT